jgi:hypothetical protein
MRSCFILGCGRSGTSLTAGLLAAAGYFMGDELYPADDGNPKGYFEDREVNGINEGLLAKLLPGPRRGLTDRILGRRPPPTRWYRWLAMLTSNRSVVSTPKLDARIEAQIGRRPFCFKDPRFCYTLGAWRRYAPDAAMICVFRHPAPSAASIVTEAARSGLLLDGRPVDRECAARVWQTAYDYVINVQLPAGGDWLFAHYEQLMDGSAYPRLEDLLSISVDRSFADTKLRRNQEVAAISPEAAAIYRKLCELAGYDGR